VAPPVEQPPADFEPPKVEAPPVQIDPSKLVPVLLNGYPQLRDLTPAEAATLRPKLGIGSKSVMFYTPSGDLIRMDKVFSTEIPHEFLVLGESVNG